MSSHSALLLERILGDGPLVSRLAAISSEAELIKEIQTIGKKSALPVETAEISQMLAGLRTQEELSDEMLEAVVGGKGTKPADSPTPPDGPVAPAPPSGEDINGDAENNELTGTDYDDTMNGHGGWDTMTGGAGNDVMYGGENSGVTATVIESPGGESLIEHSIGGDDMDGGEGDDTMYGADGWDMLKGGTGNDVISGGEGYDTLIGGEGDDQLTGGEGADVFVFDQNSGNDTITDFEPDADMLRMPHIQSTEDFSVTHDNGNTIIHHSDGATITLQNVNMSDDEIMKLITLGNNSE